MEPYYVTIDGRELGNAAAVGEMLRISPGTYQKYVTDAVNGKTTRNPAPGPVAGSTTGQLLYSLDEVRAWDKRRPGQGNWGGAGAPPRPVIGRADCPVCGRRVDVRVPRGTDTPVYARHFPQGVKCEKSRQPASSWEPVSRFAVR
jgi:hypothetical protein